MHMEDEQKTPTGFLLIEKPVDWTSHDVVGYVRKLVRQSTGVKKVKVGHAGTLDPFATGLLIVGVGREATKRMDEFKDMDKEYVADIALGATSDTQDRTGTITHSQANQEITKQQVQEVLQTFVGKQKQIPPMHSAKKVGGKKLYELARAGQEIEREPAEIEIYELELISFSPEHISIRVFCSKGTYIRTLAHDIGQKLGVGAYCQELKRTKIANFSVENAIIPTDLSAESWQTHLFS